MALLVDTGLLENEQVTIVVYFKSGVFSENRCGDKTFYLGCYCSDKQYGSGAQQQGLNCKLKKYTEPANEQRLKHMLKLSGISK